MFKSAPSASWNLQSQEIAGLLTDNPVLTCFVLILLSMIFARIMSGLFG